MITITSAVENALAQDSRTFLVKLWGGSTEVGGSVRALKVNKGSCGAEKFELGAVYSPYITATIDYDGATMDNLNGKELLVQIGVNVGTLDDPNYSYIDIGYFTVIKPQVQGTLVYITAYGRLSLLTDMYPTDSQQTLQQVLSTITTTTGMAVTVKGDLDLTGTVSGLSGWTILETLQIVAGLVGGYVTEDNAGGIVLASYDAYSETDTTRNPATIYVSNDNDFKALPTLLDAETVLDGITCYKSLAVGDAGADKFVYGTGLYEYANEYMTQTMFDNMTAKIGGWSHRAGVLNMAHGTPILEPWDAVQIIAGGVTFVIPCMSIEIVFDGGIACNVASVGKTVADEETHFQGALSQRVARTLEVAQEAQDTAEEAKNIADNTAQYFWYTGTGTDTGAHITEIPSTDFLQNPSGGNLLARSNGIAVRDGLTELASFGSSGMEVFNGSTSIASFGSTVRIGTTDVDASRIEIQPDRFEVRRKNSSNDYDVFRIGYSSSSTHGPYLRFGYNPNSATSGNYCVMIGYNANAVGDYSHAEGYEVETRGLYSHAQGFYAKATGKSSHANGIHTTAQGYAQTVIGEYNTVQGTSASRVNTDYAFIIGNGTGDSARSNALTVDWSGNVVANSFTGSLIGNATTSTRASYACYASDGTLGLTAYSSNEINFLGSSTQTGVYIGYRSMGSTNVQNYYFCNSTASTSGRGNIYCGALNTNGLVSITNYGVTGTFGALNSGFFHIQINPSSLAIALYNDIATVTGGSIGTKGYPVGQIYMKNHAPITWLHTNGTNSIELVRFSNSNEFGLGNGSYVTKIYGSTVYAKGTSIGSDIRLKENIKDIGAEYDNVLLGINPISFDWKKDIDEYDGKRHYGIIAQELIEKLKEQGISTDKMQLVEDLDGKYCVCYTELIPMLIHLCQSQQREIEEMKEKLQ